MELIPRLSAIPSRSTRTACLTEFPHTLGTGGPHPIRFLTFLLLSSLAFAADLPTAESILARSLAKSGGAAAHAKVKGAIMTGKVEIVGHNISGPVQVFQQGDKNYTVIELPGVGKVEEGYDGETAWEVNALSGPRIKDGEEKNATVRASRLDLLTAWKDLYKEARTVGEENLDGKPAWKVQLTPNDGGKPETLYFDKTSALLVRMSQTIPTALGEIPVEAELSDYRSVAGVLTPFSMTQKAMSQVMTMRFDKVQWNPAIPPDRFDLPPAIRALKK
jgi:outer membrane lipoprotein-sorting protein